jgi:hypothetical protein
MQDKESAMVLAQSALDSVRADALIGDLDNSSVVISVPEGMPVQSRKKDTWTIRALVAQEVLNIEEARQLTIHKRRFL